MAAVYSTLFNFAAELTRSHTAFDAPARVAALTEALPESNGYEGWLEAAVDVSVPDAEIGRRARELILAYLSNMAMVRGGDLEEVTRG